jgi:hypothetical protein
LRYWPEVAKYGFGSPRRSARRHSFGQSADDYDIQTAKRGLGRIRDRIETANKPKAP